MRLALHMCCALDMPCGARRDLYHIESAQPIYRVCIAHLSILRQQKYRHKVAVRVMPDNKNQLRDDSLEFAILVSDLCDEIKGCGVYVNQLLRCSSSVGANLHEARYAQSRADFIKKLEVSLKECYETEYWLELLYRKNRMSQADYSKLMNYCGSIRRRLIASVTTAKNNR